MTASSRPSPSATAGSSSTPRERMAGRPSSEIKYTFAYEPLQQYLVDIGRGRLQALDIAWDTARGRWFWLGSGTPGQSPARRYHWTGPFYPLEPHLHRLSFDRSSGEVSAIGDERIQVDLRRHQHRLSVLSRPRREACCFGAVDQCGVFPQDGYGRFRRSDAGICFACHARRSGLLDGYQPGKPISTTSLPPCCGRTFISPTDRSSTRSSNTARFSKAKWLGRA